MVNSALNEHDAAYTIQELSFDEIEILGGADAITSGLAVGGAGAAAGGLAGGPPGAAVGAIVGFVLGVAVHYL